MSSGLRSSGTSSAGHVLDGLDERVVLVLDLEHLEHRHTLLADPYTLPDTEFDHVSTTRPPLSQFLTNGRSMHIAHSAA